MSEIHKTVRIDGLIEFGEYLTTLDQTPYRDYTFEIPDDADKLKHCSLDDVLKSYQAFCSRKTDAFRVCIGYSDYQHNTIGHSDRTFTRRKS
jgi:hypothetical protein